MKFVEGDMVKDTSNKRIQVTVALSGSSPFPVEVMVFEEDTNLILTVNPVFKYKNEHIVRTMTDIMRSKKHKPGSVIMNGNSWYAVVLDLDKDPACRTEWCEEAFDQIFHLVKKKQISSLALPILGTVHGNLLIEQQVKQLLIRTSSMFLEHLDHLWILTTREEVERVKKIVDSWQVAPADEAPPSESGLTTDIRSIISSGESHFVEFKSSILWSARFSGQQIQQSNSPEVKKYGKNASKFIVAKTIAGFLNSDGGDLIIGIKENKDGGQDEVIGIEQEFPQLQDQCIDGHRRMIVDQVIKKFLPSNIFNRINHYIQIKFIKIEGKNLCCIHANKSDTPVYLSNKNANHFFVRIDASTREIHDKQVIDYCKKRFF